jgi:hypothetical protein
VTGKKSVAVLDLQSFINHVNAQSGKKLTATQAWSLVAAATQIKTVLAIAPAAAAKTIR